MSPVQSVLAQLQSNWNRATNYATTIEQFDIFEHLYRLEWKKQAREGKQLLERLEKMLPEMERKGILICQADSSASCTPGIIISIKNQIIDLKKHLENEQKRESFRPQGTSPYPYARPSMRSTPFPEKKTVFPKPASDKKIQHKCTATSEIAMRFDGISRDDILKMLEKLEMIRLQDGHYILCSGYEDLGTILEIPGVQDGIGWNEQGVIVIKNLIAQHLKK